MLAGVEKWAGVEFDLEPETLAGSVFFFSCRTIALLETEPHSCAAKIDHDRSAADWRAWPALRLGLLVRLL